MNIIEKLELEWQKSPVKPDQFLLSQDDYEEFHKTLRVARQIMDLNDQLIKLEHPKLPMDVKWDEFEFRGIPVRWDGRREK